MKGVKALDIGLLVAAAVAVFVVFKKFGPGQGGLLQAGAIPVLKTPDYISQIINNALPSQPGYGYDYFSDGTVIDGSGNYYYQGELVWSPQNAAAGQY